jgi:phenylalanyl-tRNA synthetase beta chain
MRVPLEWLRDVVEVPDGATADEVAADLVRVGLEEEGVHGGDVTGPLVVGRVLEYVDEPQKNGKTIRWCSVDVGDDATDGPAGRGRGIVCGASNFAVDDLVVVVLPGAVLPGGFAISARKTYGHVSDGMICSAKELGLGDDHAGIIVLREYGLDAAPGDDAIPLLGLDQRTVEVNVTPTGATASASAGSAGSTRTAGGSTSAPPSPTRPPSRCPRRRPTDTPSCWPTRRRSTAGTAAAGSSRGWSAGSTRRRPRRSGCGGGCSRRGCGRSR